MRRSVRDEFDFHLEMTVAELIEAGMSRRAAEEEARRRFGRFELYCEVCRRIGKQDLRSRRWRETMRDLGQDLRFATRRLARSPLFTVVALVTLALGIGANTAVFTLVNGVVLQPLPYRAPGELVAVWMERTDGSAADSFSYVDYLDIKAQSTSLEDVGFWTWWSMDITDADEPVSVPSVRVSANMLELIGVEPTEGRLFRPEEQQEGNDKVAIVSYRLWQDHYGGRPLVGTDIEIDGDPHRVVGIMPEGFRFPYVLEYGAGFWTPLPMDAESSRSSRWINVVARLSPGSTVEQAQTELRTIAGRLAAEYPATNAGWSMPVTSFHDSVVSTDTRAALWILYGVVGFVLLIACANLANLLLARMESRQHEIAVRAALGAGRGRLVRELLAESTLMCAAGGALGLLLAVWGMNVFLSWLPGDIPRLDEVGVDAAVLLFATAITVTTAALFGLLPALHASRADLQETLKTASTRGGTSRRRFRSALVVAEVAVALVLLVGAGLLLRSFGNLLNEEIGFDPERVLTFQMSPAYEEAARRTSFYQEALERLAQLPGVQRVGANSSPPLTGVQWSMAYTVDGLPLPGAGEEPSAEYNVVSPQYFRTLGIPLVDGRFTSDEDTVERGRVVLVNETFARRHWPEGNALGKSISIGDRAGGGRGPQPAEPPSYEIVGVVADTRKLGMDREPPAELYVPYSQSAPHFMNFLLRTTGDPAAMVDAVRSQIWAIDDSVAIEDVATMAGLVRRAVAEPRFNAMLVGGFALLAVVLATIGIYGVVAYAATQRNREMGVRIALGAGRGDIFRLLMGEGFVLTLLGVGLGIAGALAANRVMAGMVYGVSTTDPLTFATVALMLLMAALAAAYAPARRATRVDPLQVLRDD